MVLSSVQITVSQLHDWFSVAHIVHFFYCSSCEEGFVNSDMTMIPSLIGDSSDLVFCDTPNVLDNGLIGLKLMLTDLPKNVTSPTVVEQPIPVSKFLYPLMRLPTAISQ